MCRMCMFMCTTRHCAVLCCVRKIDMFHVIGCCSRRRHRRRRRCRHVHGSCMFVRTKCVHVASAVRNSELAPRSCARCALARAQKPPASLHLCIPCTLGALAHRKLQSDAAAVPCFVQNVYDACNNDDDDDVGQQSSVSQSVSKYRSFGHDVNRVRTCVYTSLHSDSIRISTYYTIRAKSTASAFSVHSFFFIRLFRTFRSWMLLQSIETIKLHTHKNTEQKTPPFRPYYAQHSNTLYRKTYRKFHPHQTTHKSRE